MPKYRACYAEIGIRCIMPKPGLCRRAFRAPDLPGGGA